MTRRFVVCIHDATPAYAREKIQFVGGRRDQLAYAGFVAMAQIAMP